MRSSRSSAAISAIVAVGARQTDAAELYAAYKAGLDALGQEYELIFVLDGPRPAFAAGLRELLAHGEEFTVVSLTREFGDATALLAGFEQASGQTIVTLPSYHQVEPAEIAKLVEATESNDVAIGWRWPRAGGIFERIRRAAFHGLVGMFTKLNYHDLGCNARAFDRRVLEEIRLYGDQHRFLALLADRQGFRVKEVAIRQSPKDRRERGYGSREYLRALLDVLSIFFVVRFTKKPLRFFGMLGAATFIVGALLVTWLVVERMFFGEGLSDRPALLLASLLVVLGLQLFALGLLGELVIFTHARQIRDYQIDSVIRYTRNAVAIAHETPAAATSNLSRSTGASLPAGDNPGE
ncbi:MAG: glycosyltransferase [Steroidobacteraceae bacterium]|nr:glycosyltransferase [Steroidobacteraceae bacterium]